MSATPVSVESIHFQAGLGLYYDQKKEAWAPMNNLEWVIRYFLSYFHILDTAEIACEKRSWKAIAALPVLPEKIADTIDRYFHESRSHKDKLYHVAGSISKIYAKIWQKRHEGIPVLLQIQENSKRRLFDIEYNTKSVKVVNSGYAVLDFYDGNDKIYTNLHDDLLDQDVEDVLARVKKITYVSKDGLKTTPQLAVFEGRSEAPLFSVQNEGDESTFVIREPYTNKMLAIALWSREIFQTWSLTLAEPNFWAVNDQHWSIKGQPLLFSKSALSRLDLLVWSLLKHSQGHMEGVRERPYVKNYTA